MKMKFLVIFLVITASVLGDNGDDAIENAEDYSTINAWLDGCGDKGTCIIEEDPEYNRIYHIYVTDDKSDEPITIDLEEFRTKREVKSEEQYKEAFSKIYRFEDGSFFFRGQLFEANCKPSFQFEEFINTAPAYGSCLHYYKLKKVLKDVYKPVLHSCEQGKMYDDVKDSCVEVEELPSHCKRNLSFCPEDLPERSERSRDLFKAFNRRVAKQRRFDTVTEPSKDLSNEDSFSFSLVEFLKDGTSTEKHLSSGDQSNAEDDTGTENPDFVSTERPEIISEELTEIPELENFNSGNPTRSGFEYSTEMPNAESSDEGSGLEDSTQIPELESGERNGLPKNAKITKRSIIKIFERSGKRPRFVDEKKDEMREVENKRFHAMPIAVPFSVNRENKVKRVKRTLREQQHDFILKQSRDETPPSKDPMQVAVKGRKASSFIYKGYYYDESCVPLSFKNEKAPYPGDCRLYFYIPLTGKTPLLMKCKSKIFSPVKGRCVEEREPQDCYQSHGCKISSHLKL